jgi:hypothetical protein
MPKFGGYIDNCGQSSLIVHSGAYYYDACVCNRGKSNVIVSAPNSAWPGYGSCVCANTGSRANLILAANARLTTTFVNSDASITMSTGDGGDWGNDRARVCNNSAVSLVGGYVFGYWSAPSAWGGLCATGTANLMLGKLMDIGTGYRLVVNGNANFLMGYSWSGGPMLSQGTGSFAMGAICNAYDAAATLCACGTAAFAFGYNGSCCAAQCKTGCGVIAKGNNLAQFFPGCNTLGYSLAVGVGIRLFGLCCLPGSPRNGDFAVGSDGYVCVYDAAGAWHKI